MRDDAVHVRRRRVHVSVYNPREQPHLDAGIGSQLVQDQLQALRMKRRPAMVELPPIVGRNAVRDESTLPHGLYQLAHEPAHQHAFAVGHGIERRHQAGRGHASQAAHGLY